MITHNDSITDMLSEIDRDFADAPDDAKQLKWELESFPHICYYETHLKRIIYDNAEDALFAYWESQKNEMLKYKWLESEKCGCDLGENCICQWIIKYAAKFASFWKHTHAFVDNHRPDFTT